MSATPTKPEDGEKCVIEYLGLREFARWSDRDKGWVRKGFGLVAEPKFVSRWWSLSDAAAKAAPVKELEIKPS